MVKSKIQELQTLRAISIVAVVLYHYFPNTFNLGYLGVDIFFVISGMIVAKIVKENQPTAINFLLRRIGRLLGSAILVVIPFTIFIFFNLNGDELKNFYQSAITFFLGISNLLFQMEASYFTDFTIRKPLLHTWSLSLEIQFYCFIALMIVLSNKYLSRLVLLTGVISFCLYVYFQFVQTTIVIPFSAGNSSALFFNPVFRFWQFGLGFIIWSHYYKTRKEVSLFLNIIFLIIILISFILYNLNNTQSSEFAFLAILTTFGCGVLLISRKNLIPTSNFLTRIGDSSYILYLVHFPILFIFEWYDFITPFLLSIGILISFIFADFLTRNLEPKIILAIKKKNKLLLFAPIISLILVSIYTSSDLSKYNHQEYITKEKQINHNRLVLIDSVLVDGRCQYFDGSNVTISSFLNEWNCNSEQNNSYIFGDSTAADLKMAFIEYGYKIGHLGGAGCSIDPKFMTQSCKTLFNEAIRYLNNRESKKDLNIILRQRYYGRDLSEKSLNRIRNFWDIENSKIIMTPYPIESPRMKGIYRKMAHRGKLPLPASMQLEINPYKKSLNILSSESWNKNLIFDPDEFIFQDKNNVIDENGEFFLKDQVHWSPGKRDSKTSLVKNFCERFICS
jgi:peptidoglycan/LPS O-acetylase OafA/YrhL